MINIETIAGQDYLVNVGFGGIGALTHPIRLLSDNPSTNIGHQSLRLLLSYNPVNTRRDKQLWC